MTNYGALGELLQTTARLADANTELDKSADGPWRLRCRPHLNAELRMLIGHRDREHERDTFLAEVKVIAPSDRSVRSGDGFHIVGWFELSFYEIVEVGFEEMKRKPDEYSLDGFPKVWREEFEALVCYWGRVLMVLELGAAVGYVGPGVKQEPHGAIGGENWI